jgi:hypothetical protein
MVSSAGTYLFAFRAICIGCTPGTSPIDPSKSAQLESEYQQFQEALTQFDNVLNRITTLASHWRVGINPKDQPGPTDPAEAMALYGELNSRLASLCEEPARPVSSTMRLTRPARVLVLLLTVVNSQAAPSSAFSRPPPYANSKQAFVHRSSTTRPLVQTGPTSL